MDMDMKWSQYIIAGYYIDRIRFNRKVEREDIINRFAIRIAWPPLYRLLYSSIKK